MSQGHMPPAEVMDVCQPRSDDGDLKLLWEPAIHAATNMPPHFPFVEIGVRDGGSSALLMHAIAASGIKRPLVCIDNYEDDQYQQFYPRSIQFLREISRKLGVVQFSHSPLTSTEWIGSMNPIVNTRYAFVYLDGSHDCKDVSVEVEYFLPRIATGGWIVIDNVNWPQENGKVKLDGCLTMFDRSQIHGVKIISQPGTHRLTRHG